MAERRYDGGGDWPRVPSSVRRLLARSWEPTIVPLLVIGDAMLDVYVLGDAQRLSPEAPVPVLRQDRCVESLGGAANVAANIAGMGGACRLVSGIGNDAEGGRLAQLLSNAKVEHDLIVTPRPTILKSRFVARNNQLLRVDKEDPTPVDADIEERLIASLRRHTPDCAVIVISDYNKGLLTKRVLAEAISLGRLHGKAVIVDPKHPDLRLYKGASHIKPNRKELESAVGMPTRSNVEVEQAAAKLASFTDAKILVTRSEAGISLVRPLEPAVHMPTYAREIIDVTGAGDTVLAAFALALGSGYDEEEAVALANLAAGIAVVRAGTTVVSRRDLERERALVADHDTAKGESVSLDMAVRLRKRWGEQGLSVGFTNGCFDLLHPGHIALLRGAAKACERLIVGLNSDRSVRRLKGDGRPIQTVDARATVLGAVDVVDLVVIFEEDTPQRVIDALVPDLLVKGSDYKLNEIVGADTVRQAGGRVMTIDQVAGHSSTALINKHLQR